MACLLLSSMSLDIVTLLPFSIVNANRHLLTTVVIVNRLKIREHRSSSYPSVISHSIKWIRNQLGRQTYLYIQATKKYRLQHNTVITSVRSWFTTPSRYDILFINVAAGDFRGSLLLSKLAVCWGIHSNKLSNWKNKRSLHFKEKFRLSEIQQYVSIYQNTLQVNRTSLM